LISRRTGSYVFKIGQPCRAAKLPATYADTAKTTSFLSQADLPHFDANSEFAGQEFNELTEVYPVVGRVKEGSLRVVCLILDI
jgi:hypothetical protein